MTRLPPDFPRGWTRAPEGHQLPQSIADHYRDKQIVHYYHRTGEILIYHGQMSWADNGYDRWIWDAASPGQGRWLQVG